MDHGIFLEAYRIMAVTNWENLAKNGMNPQTIPAYVDEKIGEHNADATAHLASEASLAAHRASVVCDHLAESVVNDKIRKSARRYVAIVDPSDDEAFDTLESALTYAHAQGGGDIFLVSGTHYISSSSVNVNRNIGLFGNGISETSIESNSSSMKRLYIRNIASGGASEPYFIMEGISFGKNDHPVRIEEESDYATSIVQNCEFWPDPTGTDVILRLLGQDYQMNEITNNRFICNNNQVIVMTLNAKFSGNTFIALDNGSYGISGARRIIIENNQFRGISDLANKTAHNWINDMQNGTIISNNYFESQNTADWLTDGESIVMGNEIQMANNANFNITGPKNRIVGNHFYCAGTGAVKVLSGSNYNTVIGNVSNKAVTNAGTGNQIGYNTDY